MRSIRLTKCCFSLILITLPQTLATLTGPCYNLVGDELGDTFAPCNPDASVASACCQTNVTSYGDICLDSGLCMATANEAVGFVFQAGCTDSSGAADGCPTLCSSIASSSGWGGVNVLQCETGTWCCRQTKDTTNCCNNTDAIIRGTDFPIGRLLFNTSEEVSSLIASASASSTGNGTSSIASATSSSSAANSTSATSTGSAGSTGDTSSPSDNSTAIVGGVLGGLLGLSLLALASTLYLLRQARSHLRQNSQSHHPHSDAYQQMSSANGVGSENSVFLAPNSSPTARSTSAATELDHRAVGELPDSSYKFDQQQKR